MRHDSFLLRESGAIPTNDTDAGTRCDGRMHLAHGVHHCLGAPRARLEGRVALGGLIARTPRSTMNGLAVLPVRLR